jgi:Flp pilus assembly protein TadG
MPARPSRLSGDDGSSIAEFAMISILLVFLLFAVLQVAALFYVRSVAAAAASDGARYAANADIDPSAGGSRASAAIGQGLGVGDPGALLGPDPIGVSADRRVRHS